MSYFPEPHANKNKIEGELDLSNYATKTSSKKRQQASTHQIFLKRPI